MAEISFVVDRLNEPPFNMGLTLVTFDEKSPFELLEIVNAVMAFLSPDHRIDLRDETPERTANRMVEFLRVMNYKHNVDMMIFKQCLLQGDPNVIYPMLHWMLQRLPDLQKRAYLARFLVDVEVPEHMFTDEEIMEVHQNYKDLQEEFKEVHKTSEKYKSHLISPTEIKRAIMQMEEDKEQLVQKVEGLHNKLKGVDNFDGMLGVVSELRREQDEQIKLAERLKEQRSQRVQAEHRLHQMMHNLQQMKMNTVDGDGEVLLKKLQEEVQKNRFMAYEKLPKEIEEKQTRMEYLQAMLHEPPVTDAELGQLSNDIKRLKSEIAALQEKRNAQLNVHDDKLQMFRQQSALIGKKKEQVLERLESTQKEKSELEAELMDKMKQYEGFRGNKVLKGEDFRKYASELRGKTAQYKRMKTELAEMRAEWGVLSRTQAILQGYENTASTHLSEQEKKAGVSGFQATQDTLEKVTIAKAEADEAKGQTLEQISKVVEEINQSIKARKNKLAPQIKELRALRAKYQELEGEYLEKKSIYENTAAGLESELSKLSEECTAYNDECMHEESRFHYLNCLQSIISVAINRVKDEHDGKKIDKDNEDGTVNVTSYKDLYTAKVKEQEGLCKDLREKQKKIKETFEPNLAQVGMFTDLQRLLKCKQQLQAKAANEQMQMGMGMDTYGDTNIFTLPDEPAAEQGMRMDDQFAQMSMGMEDHVMM